MNFDDTRFPLFSPALPSSTTTFSSLPVLILSFKITHSVQFVLIMLLHLCPSLESYKKTKKERKICLSPTQKHQPSIASQGWELTTPPPSTLECWLAWHMILYRQQLWLLFLLLLPLYSSFTFFSFDSFSRTIKHFTFYIRKILSLWAVLFCLNSPVGWSVGACDSLNEIRPPSPYGLL